MNQVNKENKKELTPEEMKGATGGSLYNIVHRPRRPWDKPRKPEEGPQDDAETGEAGD